VQFSGLHQSTTYIFLNVTRKIQPGTESQTTRSIDIMVPKQIPKFGVIWKINY